MRWTRLLDVRTHKRTKLTFTGNLFPVFPITRCKFRQAWESRFDLPARANLLRFRSRKPQIGILKHAIDCSYLLFFGIGQDSGQDRSLLTIKASSLKRITPRTWMKTRCQFFWACCWPRLPISQPGKLFQPEMFGIYPMLQNNPKVPGCYYSKGMCILKNDDGIFDCFIANHGCTPQSRNAIFQTS